MKINPFSISGPKERINHLSAETIKRAAAPIRLELPKEFHYVRKMTGDDTDIWWFLKNPALGNEQPARILYTAPQGKSKLVKWFGALMEGKDPYEGIIDSNSCSH